jgi:hypothetical protein
MEEVRLNPKVGDGAWNGGKAITYQSPSVLGHTVSLADRRVSPQGRTELSGDEQFSVNHLKRTIAEIPNREANGHSTAKWRNLQIRKGSTFLDLREN